VLLENIRHHQDKRVVQVARPDNIRQLDSQAVQTVLPENTRHLVRATAIRVILGPTSAMQDKALVWHVLREHTAITMDVHPAARVLPGITHLRGSQAVVVVPPGSTQLQDNPAVHTLMQLALRALTPRVQLRAYLVLPGRTYQQGSQAVLVVLLDSIQYPGNQAVRTPAHLVPQARIPRVLLLVQLVLLGSIRYQGSRAV
jgi:hypothetical protein